MLPQVVSVATPEDEAGWTRLRCLFWPGCPPERQQLEIAQLLGGDGIVAVAKLDGQIVGFAEVSLRSDHVEGTSFTPVPYLEGWYVMGEYRGRGIGASLLRFVEQWALQRARGSAYSILAHA